MLKWISKSAWTYDAQTGEEAEHTVTFDRDPEAAGENVFAGTVTISGQRGRVEVNDGLTVEAGGLVESSAASTIISGKSYNYGTIQVTGGTLYLQNTGYSVYNMGEISVSGGAVLNAAGTVVVNTGSMTCLLYTSDAADE